ncbi:MAG: hypothetical protein A4S09_17395 [Proteobacteria bacterium SG_bin7]|nr:MAG: hypothetical protein A4S09_17395 [Proteobacteria bacterium SG_bin7]
MTEQTVPFSLQCVCGHSFQTRIARGELVAGSSFVNECLKCKKTLILSINSHDQVASTISYLVQIRDSEGS